MIKWNISNIFAITAIPLKITLEFNFWSKLRRDTLYMDNYITCEIKLQKMIRMLKLYNKNKTMINESKNSLENNIVIRVLIYIFMYIYIYMPMTECKKNVQK